MNGEVFRRYVAPLRTSEGWLPFLGQLRGYGADALRADLIAGLTVGLVTVPQAMAYAIVAGLPPVYGLYAAIVAGAVGALFGSSSHLITGPSVISIVVASVLALVPAGPDLGTRVAALCLAVGIIQLGFGILRLGNIGQLVSQSVLLGLISGAAVVITGTQIAPLLGLSTPHDPMLIPAMAQTLRHLPDLCPRDLALGLGVAAIMVFGERWQPRAPWPLVALGAAAGAVALLGWDDLATIGAIARGTPPWTMNRDAVLLFPEVASPALALALLASISSLSIAKSIGSFSGERVAANRELTGQGMANVACAAFGGLPSSGSFVRSFAAYAAGGRTRFAGLFSAGFVMLMLALLGGLGRWMPRSALAGMIIVLALRMLQLDRVRVACRATKSDAAVVLLTFLAAILFRLDAAIYIGVGLSLTMFLKRASSPYLREYSIEEGGGFREIHAAGERRFAGIAIIHVEGDLFFGAAELFENEVKTLAQSPGIRIIILRMRGARYLDATGLVAMANLNNYLRSRGQHLLLCGIGDRVEQILRNSGLAARIGEDHLFHARDGVLESTRRALIKAQEFAAAAGEKPKIRLFYDRQRADRDAARDGKDEG